MDKPKLKREKLGNYSSKFHFIKREFLALKWSIETNVIDESGVKKKLEKVAKLLFDIEKSFGEK